MGITHSYAAFAAFSYDSGNIAVRYFRNHDKSLAEWRSQMSAICA